MVMEKKSCDNNENGKISGRLKRVYNLQNSLAKFRQHQRELTSEKPPERLRGQETTELLSKLVKKMQNGLE